MEYIKRTLEDAFLKLSKMSKVMLLTGARQVGKTTMLKHLAQTVGEEYQYVTLDNPLDRKLAQEDPLLFFQRYQAPLIIDEIQYAPELFPILKMIVDESETTGSYWLTGSQQYDMMSHVQESLAGRISIMHLYSLSYHEIIGVEFPLTEDAFSLPSLLDLESKVPETNLIDVFQRIWQGGMPRIVGQTEELFINNYFEDYIQTYLMRDVLELGGVKDTVVFATFLSACAALNGEQVNYKTLADTVGIDQRTAKNWLNLLVGLGILYLLRPYANNALKRLSKQPKLYFVDSGLAAYLTNWPTPETLMDGAASGHFFEAYVVMEMVKNLAYSQKRHNLSYYRDSNGKEIDLVVELGRSIHAFEVKKATQPKAKEVQKFTVFDKTNFDIGNGGIICLAPKVIPINEGNNYIPINLI